MAIPRPDSADLCQNQAGKENVFSADAVVSNDRRERAREKLLWT